MAQLGNTIINGALRANGKINASGAITAPSFVGQHSGQVLFPNNTWNPVGDDVYIGDCNQGGKLGIKGKNNNTGIYMAPADTATGTTPTTLVADGNGVLTISGTTKGTFSGNLTGTASQITGTLTNPTSTTSYYIPFHAGDASGAKSIGFNNGIRYHALEGTTSVTGAGILILGNGAATGSAGNKYGALQLASTKEGGVTLRAADTTTGKTIYLPAADGTLALTTSNVASATKLQTARTITLGGVVTGSTTFDGSGNKTITTAIDGFSTIQTITKSMTLTTAWQDTGILTSNLTAGSGSYLIQVSINGRGTGNSYYDEFWTGVMSVYNGTSNSADSDEIILHKNGHASNGNTIFLRLTRQIGNLYSKLQIADTVNWTAAATITFKFRRLI